MTRLETILWTAQDVAQATGTLCENDFSATGISIDTRTLQKGEIYVALVSKAQDGHVYVTAAFKAGAVAAIVSNDYAAQSGDGILIRVADTNAALSALGYFARARIKGVVIGVTGSAGKTGTKELLAHILSVQGKTHASRKSYNNHWGVPLTLANCPPDVDFGIFEMGMNHAGEMAALTAMVRPDIALITTIEPAHIEHFITVDAIADAKAEIFESMHDRGTAILNMDNPQFQRLFQHAQTAGVEKIITFGEDEKADAEMQDCVLHADSSRVTARICGIDVKYKLNIPGRHIAMNALAALAVVKAAGADVYQASESLKTAEPVAGRGNRVSIIFDPAAPPVLVIDESYNANPASMAAAISVLEMAIPQGQGRRVAVLGDMLELGREGPQIHKGLANTLLKARADIVFCCGAQMEALYQALPPAWQGGHATDSRALADLVTAAIQPGDVVLVKGSNSIKLGYVVQALLDYAAQKNVKQA